MVAHIRIGGLRGRKGYHINVGFGPVEGLSKQSKRNNDEKRKSSSRKALSQPRPTVALTVNLSTQNKSTVKGKASRLTPEARSDSISPRNILSQPRFVVTSTVNLSTQNGLRAKDDAFGLTLGDLTHVFPSYKGSRSMDVSLVATWSLL